MTSAASAMNEIRDALTENQLCIVVGTGVSAAATNGNVLASWRGLISDGLDRCLAMGSRDEQWVDRAKQDVNSKYENDLIVAAEKATDGLGGRRSPDYATWLRDTVGQLSAVDQTLLDPIRTLAHNGAIVATTNYDDILEKELGYSSVTWRDTPRLQRVLRGKERAVIHLHGHWSDPESVVFGSSSYADVLRSPESVNFLRATVYVRTLLFVGFGAGLDDPNFSALRGWMSRELTESPFSHYRLVADKELSQVKTVARDRIRPVSYGADHGELPAYLTSIFAGVVGGGMRSRGDLSPAPEILERSAGERTGIPLPARRDAPLRDKLRLVSQQLEWVAQAAILSDDEAVPLLGDGTEVDNIRRFSSLFEEEISEVLRAAGKMPGLEDPAVQSALAKGIRLLAILDIDARKDAWPSFPNV
jgi:hypothetical protein